MSNNGKNVFLNQTYSNNESFALGSTIIRGTISGGNEIKQGRDSITQKNNINIENQESIDAQSKSAKDYSLRQIENAFNKK